MNDMEQLEAAMERAHRAQLGWVFVKEYLQHRKTGECAKSAIAKIETKWTIPHPLSALLHRTFQTGI